MDADRKGELIRSMHEQWRIGLQAITELARIKSHLFDETQQSE